MYQPQQWGHWEADDANDFLSPSCDNDSANNFYNLPLA
jgi:hypothetical protein